MAAGGISRSAGQLTQKSTELKIDEAFFQYHKWAKDETAKAARYGEKTVGALQRISTAWGGIKSDLTDLYGRLLDQANKDALSGDWDFAKLDLEDAQTEWDRLAAEAAGYLQNQIETAGGTTDIGKAMQGIKLAA